MRSPEEETPLFSVTVFSLASSCSLQWAFPVVLVQFSGMNHSMGTLTLLLWIDLGMTTQALWSVGVF